VARHYLAATPLSLTQETAAAKRTFRFPSAAVFLLCGRLTPKGHARRREIRPPDADFVNSVSAERLPSVGTTGSGRQSSWEGRLDEIAVFR
jgi:hypothetical protein